MYVCCVIRVIREICRDTCIIKHRTTENDARDARVCLRVTKTIRRKSDNPEESTRTIRDAESPREF